MKLFNRSLFFLILPFLTFGQSSLKDFKKLSKAEKCWVITHVFKAKRALKVSKKVKQTVDSILKVGDLGKHYVGNDLDAFKHAYWMFCTANRVGFKAAKSLGKAHEKGNYQFYKKHKKEDGVLPDSISSQMDLHNNSIGLAYYKKNKKKQLSKKQQIALIKKAVLEGQMKIILQKEKGVYLDNNGRVLSKISYHNLWNNSKVLVPSNSL